MRIAQGDLALLPLQLSLTTPTPEAPTVHDAAHDSGRADHGQAGTRARSSTGSQVRADVLRAVEELLWIEGSTAVTYESVV